MTSPRRLLDEGTPFERDVLGSARQDAGGAAGHKRTLAVMGLGAAAATAASSIGSARIAAGTTAGAGASVAPASAGTGAFVKWIALALVVGSAVTTPAISWVSRKTPIVAATVASPPTMMAGVPKPSILPRPSPSPQPATVDELPQAAAPPRSAAWSPAIETAARALGGSNRSTATPPAAQGNASSAEAIGMRATARSQPGAPDRADVTIGGAAADTEARAQGPEAHPRPASALYAELAALAGVRAALDKGDSRGALRSLAAYDSAFPGSELAEEAMVLRVDALAQGSDDAAAAALGRRFLASNPSSPHAPHVRRLIDDAHNQ